jgi:hypothetical protein
VEISYLFVSLLLYYIRRGADKSLALLLLTRRLLRTRNWQIFTLKFWNTRPTHLIWPLGNTTSFLTSLWSQRFISPTSY